jgi:glucose/arabinose dehydrogenase
MTQHRVVTVLVLVMMACLLGRSASAERLVPAFGGITFNKTTSIQQVPGNPSRWFVAERGGLIKTFSTSNLAAGARVALNISSYLQYTDTTATSNDSQQWGITSIAPSLSFRSNGYMYVAYNRRPTPGAHVFSYLSRFKANFAANAEGAVLDPRSEKILLTLDQTTKYHHIGQILFGPGNYLYIGTGDGANLLPDPRACRAQDPHSLYGKILRIDVNTVSPGKPYGIPPLNPFPNGVNGAPEVYATGFRNPWRFSFDRQNIRDMWLGDVGEATWEEVDRVVKVNTAAGQGNYGWPLYEARRRTQMSTHADDVSTPGPDAAHLCLHPCGRRRGGNRRLCVPGKRYSIAAGSVHIRRLRRPQGLQAGAAGLYATVRRSDLSRRRRSQRLLRRFNER